MHNHFAMLLYYYSTFSSYPKPSNLTHTKLFFAVVRLHLSSHNLEIERGRHVRHKTTVSSPICQRFQMAQAYDDEIDINIFI